MGKKKKTSISSDKASCY